VTDVKAIFDGYAIVCSKLLLKTSDGFRVEQAAHTKGVVENHRDVELLRVTMPFGDLQTHLNSCNAPNPDPQHESHIVPGRTHPDSYRVPQPEPPRLHVEAECNRRRTCDPGRLLTVTAMFPQQVLHDSKRRRSYRTW